MYLAVLFIDFLSFAPVAGADNSYSAVAMSKADGENTATNLTETVIAFFFLAMSLIFSDETVWVEKGLLSVFE